MIGLLLLLTPLIPWLIPGRFFRIYTLSFTAMAALLVTLLGIDYVGARRNMDAMDGVEAGETLGLIAIIFLLIANGFAIAMRGLWLRRTKKKA